MNVIIVGCNVFDSLEFHLADSFRALGHNARVIDVTGRGALSKKIGYWSARFAGSYDRVVGHRLATRIIHHNPDLVIVVYRHLHPVLVDDIKTTLPYVPVIQVNPDALSNLEKQQIIAADFDYYFSKEPYIVNLLRHKNGLNAYYLPEGFNPRVHCRPLPEKAVAERETVVDVLMYGSLYAYRARFVEQLLRAGLRVAIYGTKGPYLRSAIRAVFQGKYLVGDEKNRLVYGAKITLNTLHYAEITSANQKYFEINGIGGFQLCDDKPTLSDYSAVPTELVTFRSLSDAIDKIRYYLARPAERHELAEQQYQHFQQHHTFDHRAIQLLQTIGLA
ncbi:CgeB family protein [Spirosoma montaniterrae]|uniref:Spore protein YkvP/CgeB glycosyl transferase-like domain-containing protein n=1 Tax=Spirosoma montaniterrae TaxID=1178516 RepID=A0A1P9WYW2_9BACT|nr:glycosyltransferase [Spirosoma montaniterrae]AQG80570.1 hypothetical protein AWR27_15325 [Spirosoma montaniterrae]